MPETHKSYEDGLRDGQIIAIEETTRRHAERLDSHSRRLSVLERVGWITLGIVATIQFIPAAQKALEILSGV